MKARRNPRRKAARRNAARKNKVLKSQRRVGGKLKKKKNGRLA